MLALIDEEGDEEGDGDRGRWRDLLEQARFGGASPASEELDRLQRQVERRLEALAPDPEEQARQSLRLKDDPA